MTTTEIQAQLRDRTQRMIDRLEDPGLTDSERESLMVEVAELCALAKKWRDQETM